MHVKAKFFRRKEQVFWRGISREIIADDNRMHVESSSKNFDVLSIDSIAFLNEEINC